MKHKKMTIVLMAIMVMVAMTACSVAKGNAKPETETSVTVVSDVDTTTDATTTAEGTTTVATTTEGTTKPAEATTTTTNGTTATTTTTTTTTATTTTTVAETIPAPVETAPAPVETVPAPAETTPAPTEPTETPAPNLHATADVSIYTYNADGAMEFTVYGVAVYRNSEDLPWIVADPDALEAEIEARCPNWASYSAHIINARDERP